MKHAFSFFLNVGIAIIGIFIIFTTDISPEKFPMGVFFMFLIPPIIIIHLLFALYWLFKKQWVYLLLPLSVLVLSFKYIDRTLVFSLAADEQKIKLNVLSTNVRIFNAYDHLKDKDYRSSKRMIAWLTAHPADILCVQEFYNMDKSKVFNSVAKIKRSFPHYSMVPFLKYAGQDFGMAIFSKHPIINKGEIIFREKSNNQIIFADVQLPNKVVRVYNVHLQSMSISDKDVMNTELDKKGFNKWITFLIRYKNGSILRGRQVDELVRHMQKCPYEVIVCGDFNEPPYGYAYEELSDHLDNAYQEAGVGFGFTYNGGIPFLRIDNQFYSKGLMAEKVKLYKEIGFADHYPLEGAYSFRNKY